MTQFVGLHVRKRIPFATQPVLASILEKDGILGMSGSEPRGRPENLPSPLLSFCTFMMRNRANAVHAFKRARQSFRTTPDMRLSLESALTTAV